MQTFLVFGTSITYGAWDEKGGWTNRLQQHIHKKTIHSNHSYTGLVYNLGVSGNTSDDILERFESETTARIEHDSDVVIMFDFGTNDALFLIDQKKHVVEIDVFTQNIIALITKAQKITKNIVFVGLTPIDEAKLNPIPWATDLALTMADIELYNDTIKTITTNKHILFINLLKTLPTNFAETMLSDGDHPNTQGHEMIFDTIKQALENANVLPV